MTIEEFNKLEEGQKIVTYSSATGKFTLGYIKDIFFDKNENHHLLVIEDSGGRILSIEHAGNIFSTEPLTPREEEFKESIRQTIQYTVRRKLDAFDTSLTPHLIRMLLGCKGYDVAVEIILKGRGE